MTLFSRPRSTSCRLNSKRSRWSSNFSLCEKAALPKPKAKTAGPTSGCAGTLEDRLRPFALFPSPGVHAWVRNRATPNPPSLVYEAYFPALATAVPADFHRKRQHLETFHRLFTDSDARLSP